MKKWISIFAAVLSLSLASGCAGSSGGQAGDDKISVVASFYPMYDFASKIGGDKVSVKNLTPAGVEPHDWEPSSTDMITMEKADIFIYNGLGMETWADSVLGSLSNKKLVAVEASKNVPLLEGSENDGGGYDPHVWLNPQNAKIEMQNILTALISADPDSEAYYRENFEKYAAEIDALDSEFKTALSALPQKNIVVAHDAFGYLCDAYGLTQVPIEGLAADSEPDAARMSEIVDFVRVNGVRVIFFEELVSPKVAEAIASETGSSTAVLNPLEGLSDEDLAKGADYFSVMRANLAVLTKSLAA